MCGDLLSGQAEDMCRTAHIVFCLEVALLGNPTLTITRTPCLGRLAAAKWRVRSHQRPSGESKDNWKKVRVFDSYVEGQPAT